jgi:hypothetical protein
MRDGEQRQEMRENLAGDHRGGDVVWLRWIVDDERCLIIQFLWCGANREDIGMSTRWNHTAETVDRSLSVAHLTRLPRRKKDTRPRFR